MTTYFGRYRQMWRTTPCSSFISCPPDFQFSQVTELHVQIEMLMKGSVFPSLGRNDVIVGQRKLKDRNCCQKIFSRMHSYHLEIGLFVSLLHTLTVIILDIECKNLLPYHSRLLLIQFPFSTQGTYLTLIWVRLSNNSTIIRIRLITSSLWAFASQQVVSLDWFRIFSNLEIPGILLSLKLIHLFTNFFSLFWISCMYACLPLTTNFYLISGIKNYSMTCT